MSEILYHIDQRTAVITLNRPERMNALGPALVAELKAALTQATDDKHIKSIVLAAEGKAFCAGADLEYLQKLSTLSYEENLEDSMSMAELFVQLYSLPKPVIAAVQGHALAGGCGLVTVCDTVFSVPDAQYGFTEVRLGFIPALVSLFFSRKYGMGAARHWLISGAKYTAEQAMVTGLVNTICPLVELQTKALNYAHSINLNNSAEAMARTKALLLYQYRHLKEDVRMAVEANARMRETEDFKKGLKNFIDKTPQTW